MTDVTNMMIEIYDHNILTLKNEEKNLTKRLTEIRADLRNVLKKKWLLEHKLQIGDVISFKNAGGIKTGKLTALEIIYGDTIHPIVTLFNKNNELGKRQIQIYYPETITLIKREENETDNQTAS